MLQQESGIILYMRPANERRRYIVTASLIGWVHTQNDPWRMQNCVYLIYVFLGIILHSADSASVD